MKVEDKMVIKWVTDNLVYPFLTSMFGAFFILLRPKHKKKLDFIQRICDLYVLRTPKNLG